MSVLKRAMAMGALFFLAGMVLASMGATGGSVRFWLMVTIMVAVSFVGVMR